MSAYYNVKELKVRVSDHEPNYGAPNRGNDVILYIKDASNNIMSVESQIERFCDRHDDYEVSDFKEVINDWRDGTYNEDTFVTRNVEEEREDVAMSNSEREYNEYVQKQKNDYRSEQDKKLAGYCLSRFANHTEIKELSQKTGVSQSYIKKHFGVR
jgi:hypothetical protein